MKKTTFITLALLASIAIAARAGDKAPTLKELTAEYTAVQQDIAQKQAHLLRLEGAISILKMQDEQTTATDEVTTSSR